jgi:hypothetical protein
MRYLLNSKTCVSVCTVTVLRLNYLHLILMCVTCLLYWHLCCVYRRAVRYSLSVLIPSTVKLECKLRLHIFTYLVNTTVYLSSSLV